MAEPKHEAPWPFIGGTDEPGPGSVLIEPTPESEAMGHIIAGWVEKEIRERGDSLPVRCRDCAFRRGTRANQNGQALLDGLKCAVEGKRFDCHIDVGKACAGWVALVTASKDFDDQEPGA